LGALASRAESHNVGDGLRGKSVFALGQDLRPVIGLVPPGVDSVEQTFCLLVGQGHGEEPMSMKTDHACHQFTKLIVSYFFGEVAETP
jgi:hypothetical protein